METLDYITLTPDETAKLLSAGNPEAVLVYLYIRATGDRELRNAASCIRIPTQNLQWALTLIKRLGLLDPAAVQQHYDSERAPVYSGEAVKNFAQQDRSFRPLQAEIANRLGRTLSSEDLKTLLCIRDYLKLPPEVITMALTCCIEKTEYYNKVHGTSRTVTMRALERECYEWANQGIDNLEKATAHISVSLEQADPIARVRKALKIDRQLIDAEREYVQSWLTMGFPVETISLAFEKTIMRLGKLAWPYMNRILLNWHENNLHTVEEVNGKDRKPAAAPTAGSSPQTDAQERAAMDNLQSYLNSLKG